LFYKREMFPKMREKHSRKYRILVSFIVYLTAIFSITFAILPIPSSAQSENAGLHIQASPVFQGYFKYGEWLPIWVELENNGPDLSGSIQVRVSGSGGTMVFSTPVDLPTVSRKRLPVFVLPNNFTRELEVQFIAGDQVVASQKIPARPQPNITYTIGLIAPERGALSLINGIEMPGPMPRPILIADGALADLPERFEGLRSFDCLVLNDIDTSNFTLEQGKALENWVRQGGRLVIGGGAGMLKTVSGLPKSLLPLVPETTLEIQAVSGLSGLAVTGSQDTLPEIRVPGPFILATGSLISGKVVVAQDGIPLLVEQPLGAGNIDLFTLDLSVSPFDAWSGTTLLWQLLLAPGAAFPTWMPVDISARQQLASQMPYSLSNLPMLDIPSARGLALLLGVYILLVGPVNYLFLRWRKRLHWAWITIPAVTIIFSVGSFGLGYLLHGTDIFLNKISIIELQKDGNALVNSYMGLFSPGQQAYKVEIVGDGLISPLAPYYNPWDSAGSGVNSTQEIVLTQGNPGYVSGLSIDQWSMQSFMVEGMAIDFGIISSDLRLETNALAGTITNLTGYTIRDATVIWSKRFAHLGDLQPGQSAEVSLDLADLEQPDLNSPLSYLLVQEQFNQPNPNGPDREVEVKRSIIEGLLERTPPFKSSITPGAGQYSPLTRLPLLLGWVDQSPPQARIAGEAPAQQTTGVLLFNLGFTIQSGDISIPAGLIPGEVISYPLDGGSCGDMNTPSIYLNRGESIFRFSLPAQFANLAVNRLKLSIYTDGNWIGAPAVALFNWQTLDWVELTNIIQGINYTPDASGLINQDGEIQLRLSGKDNSQACFYLGLGLEGQQ
jgi:hypothetical protein